MTYALFLFNHPILFSGIILFVYMVCGFLIALYLKDNSIVDVAYGLGFILVSGVTLFAYQSLLGALVSLCVFVWGLRLSLRIHERNRGRGEDPRYKKWRETWTWFKTRSFFQVFMFQGLIILGIVSPVIIANTFGGILLPWHGVIMFLGFVVWIKGFFFEAWGDYQLDQFMKDPANKGKIMDKGLWAYTRHPNYFGEATMWWGVWIMALPATISVGVWVSVTTFLVSPVLITFFLLKISGVPMLEHMMEGRPGWEEYKRKTSTFIPWFPKK